MVKSSEVIGGLFKLTSIKGKFSQAISCVQNSTCKWIILMELL